MFKNYFKIAWRGLIRNKLYSAINIGGLGAGMAVSFILLIYVYNEVTFDSFHQNKDRIYKVMKNQPANGEINTGDATPVQLAGALQKDYPEIEAITRTNWGYDQLLNYNNKPLKFNLMSVDASYLNIFTLDFVKGNKQDAFRDMSSVIITESVVKALFGDKDPMGQTVKLNGNQLVKVSAVIKDLPQNSTFRFKALIPWKLYESAQPWVKGSSWGNYSFMTYVLLKPGINPDVFSNKIKNVIARYNADNKENKLFLFPFTK